jgi:hypothetical protein
MANSSGSSLLLSSPLMQVIENEMYVPLDLYTAAELGNLSVVQQLVGR